MRHLVPTLLLSAAMAHPAAGGEPAPPATPPAATPPAAAASAKGAKGPRDYREVKLLTRNILDNRRDLARLVSRRVRLAWLENARTLDRRAVAELDAAVQNELDQKALKLKLEVQPFTPLALDQALAERFAGAWREQRGRFGPAGVERRLALLEELIGVTRQDLVAALLAYRERGGSGLPEEAQADAGSSEP
jgi:hypothetical protein